MHTTTTNPAVQSGKQMTKALVGFVVFILVLSFF